MFKCFDVTCFFLVSVFESEKSSRVKSITLNNQLLRHVLLKQLELMLSNKRVFVCAGLHYDVCTLGNAGIAYTLKFLLIYAILQC